VDILKLLISSAVCPHDKIINKFVEQITMVFYVLEMELHICSLHSCNLELNVKAKVGLLLITFCVKALGKC